MEQTVFRGFELLMLQPTEVAAHSAEATTVGEVNEMLLKACGAAWDDSVSDGDFRGMILRLLDKRSDILQETMALPRM